MKWLGIVLALIAGVPVLYGVAYPSLTLHYRLTLEAEVDGKPQSGSGVIEVTYAKQPEFASGRDLISGHRGEAVVLDLGDRGTLFALLKAGSDNRSIPESIILRAYNFDGGAFPGATVEAGQQKLRQLSGKRELPLTSLPLLVRFRDIKDMNSAEEVDPLDIARHFGAGAKLMRATLEIVSTGTWPFSLFGVTGEPVTTGIEGRLSWWNGPFPWLRPLGGGVFVDTRTAKFKINKEDFKRG
ncbi:MAG: hypothetical protein ABI561_23350 [Bradyrhizobium sp.]